MAGFIIKHEVARLREARSVQGVPHAIGPKGVTLEMRGLEWVEGGMEAGVTLHERVISLGKQAHQPQESLMHT